MERIALVHGRIMTMAGPIIEQGTVYFEAGRIMAVGQDVQLPADVQVVDVAGKTILPGFIDAHTHLGILEEIYQVEGDDINEYTDPVTPQLRALDAINPYDLGFQDAVQGGVTCVMTGPGSANVIGGSAVVMKTAGNSLEQMVLLEQAGIKVAFGENPKRTYGEQKKMPTTRMGIAALIRQALMDAEDYVAKKEKTKQSQEVMERDLGLEHLALVLAQKMPLRAHAHRADDILTALRLAAEFKVPLVIEHGTEAHKIIPQLLEGHIPVVVGPTLSNRSKVELAELTWKTATLLNEAGVLVALTTDHSVIPVQYLPLCAGLAVKHGMQEEEALKAITLYPARILNLEHRLGSLESGKDADLVVLSGHPLDWRTRIEKVYVDGRLAYNGI